MIQLSSKKTIGCLFLFLVLMFFLFWFKDTRSLDSDLWWRLKTGELILEKGVPHNDFFSYTMPNYSWIEHSWLTDLGMIEVYRMVGFTGLAGLSSFLILCSITLSLSLAFTDGALSKIIRSKKNAVFFLSFPFLLLVFVGFLRFSGVRAQVLTWLMAALFFRVLFDINLWQKTRWAVPFLFLIWANLHGGFVAGLCVMTLVVVLRTHKSRKEALFNFIIVFLSVAMTFINPYKASLYTEVWNTLASNTTHKYIVEWKSFFETFEWSSLVFIPLSTVFVFIYRKRVKLEEMLTYGCLMVAAMMSVRQYPLWLIFAMPLTLRSFVFFYERIRESQESYKRFIYAFKFLFLLILAIVLAEIFVVMKNLVFEKTSKSYPVDAVSYIQKHLPSGEIFAEYDWGGYLIWSLPQKKVFIDGRMPFWKVGGEKSASEVYFGLFDGSLNYKDVFNQYDIKMVLLRSDRSNYNMLKNSDNFLYNLFGGFYAKKRGSFDIVTRLQEDGWVLAYEDDTSLVFVNSN